MELMRSLALQCSSSLFLCTELELDEYPNSLTANVWRWPEPSSPALGKGEREREREREREAAVGRMISAERDNVFRLISFHWDNQQEPSATVIACLTFSGFLAMKNVVLNKYSRLGIFEIHRSVNTQEEKQILIQKYSLLPLRNFISFCDGIYNTLITVITEMLNKSEILCSLLYALLFS